MTSLQERLFAMQDKQYAVFSKKKKERSILATDLGLSLSLICLHVICLLLQTSLPRYSSFQPYFCCQLVLPMNGRD